MHCVLVSVHLIWSTGLRTCCHVVLIMFAHERARKCLPIPHVEEQPLPVSQPAEPPGLASDTSLENIFISPTSFLKCTVVIRMINTHGCFLCLFILFEVHPAPWIVMICEFYKCLGKKILGAVMSPVLALPQFPTVLSTLFYSLWFLSLRYSELTRGFVGSLDAVGFSSRN